MFNIFLLVFQTQIVQKIKSVEATPKIWPPVSNNDFRSKSLLSICGVQLPIRFAPDREKINRRWMKKRMYL